MTRLLLIAGLTSVGVGSVHFVDGNHASFSFPAPPRSEAEGGGVRGGSGNEALHPRSGQVGVFRVDGVGHENQFVVSSDQSLPDRLVATAPVPPLRSDGAPDGGSRHGDGWGKWVGRGGGGGGGGGATNCVKFVGDVGTWGQKRDKWFPAEGDPRDLLLALDHFCPIPWLREGQEEGMADDGDEDNGEVGGRGLGGVVGGRGMGGMYVGGGRGMYGGRGVGVGVKPYSLKPRKVIIYQRDRNRKMLNSEEVSNSHE